MTIISEPGLPRPVTPMSIIASRLDRLSERLEAAGGLPSSITSELREICELAGGLDSYLGRWTTPESADLQMLAHRTEAQDWRQHPGDLGPGHLPQPGHLEQEMLSGHVEGQTLKMLVHATRARRVLEIGMFTGYSALAMAEALPDGGQVVACEIDPEVAAFAQRCFGESRAGHKILIKVGPALDTLRQLSAGGDTFDLVFIDADKAGYIDYLTTLLDSDLLAPQGLICVDNTLMQGQPWVSGEPTANGIAIAEFNEKVAADTRVEQVIVPLRDGMTLVRRVNVR